MVDPKLAEEFILPTAMELLTDNNAFVRKLSLSLTAEWLMKLLESYSSSYLTNVSKNTDSSNSKNPNAGIPTNITNITSDYDSEEVEDDDSS